MNVEGSLKLGARVATSSLKTIQFISPQLSQRTKRWIVMFDVDGEPFNITVMAETRHLAIEYAEGALWLQLGKPNLDGFAPCCLSSFEVY